MVVDLAGPGPKYPEMRQKEHRAGWLRRMAALGAALALLFHIAAMSLGVGRLPDLGNEGAQAHVHAHHATPAADHGPALPENDAGHKPPCCILSVCPGLPLPPADHVLAFLPQPEAGALAYGLVLVMAVPHLPLLPPVGARAPPALV